MVFLLTLVLSCAVGIFAQDADPCNPIVVDECGFKLYDTLMQPTKVPTTEAELDSYCKLIVEGKECYSAKIKACPSLLPAETLKAYIKAVEFATEDMCKSGGAELGKKLLPHSPCIREKLTGFGCTNDFFTKVESSVLEPKEHQLVAACCAFTQFDRCYNNEVKEKCGKPAGRSIRALIQGFGLFLVERCLPVLADPEKCNERAAKALPSNTRKIISILPGLTSVIANSEG